MIIHKLTNSVETRSDYPCSNFGNYENVFVVDDTSELGQKILLAQPLFDIVLDTKGNIIDIVPIEPPLSPPELTQDDYLIDIDYRLSMIELGL